MPTYEYQCTSCGHNLEAFQKMTDEPLTECPVCHHEGLQKIISAAGFQLKGSGWYATDYSKKGKAKSSGESEVSTDKIETPKGDTESKPTDTTAKGSKSNESNSTG